MGRGALTVRAARRYSNKMLAVLRFRRLPHRWLSMNGPEARGSAQP